MIIVPGQAGKDLSMRNLGSRGGTSCGSAGRGCWVSA